MVILLAILSITFGVFAYLNFKDIDGGDTPEKRPDELIRKEKVEISKLDNTIAEYQDKESRLTDEIAKLRWLEGYYISEANQYIASHEKRLNQKKEGQAFEQQIRAIGTTVSGVKAKTLSAIETDITNLRTEMEKHLADETTAKAKVQADVLAQKTEFENKVKRHRQEMNYEKSQLGDTKSVLADLTAREPIHAKILDRPVGKVVLADFLHNFVSISLGTGSGVKNGMRFEVFAMAPGGIHVTKAYIEVRNAGETQSECLVVQRPVLLPEDKLSGYLAKEPEEKYNPLAQSGKKGASAEVITGGRVVMTGQSLDNPIMEGDLIQNPFFDPLHQKVFYIAGSKEVVGERQKSAIRYRWTDIRDAAERHGAKVVSAIDTSVNYMIAQKNPTDDPEFKKGVDLGIPVIYEWELFRFLDND